MKTVSGLIDAEAGCMRARAWAVQDAGFGKRGVRRGVVPRAL